MSNGKMSNSALRFIYLEDKQKQEKISAISPLILIYFC